MLNSKNIVLASLSATALLMAGCSDKVNIKNSAAQAVFAASTTSGTVIDGYVKNSIVSCAANGAEATTDVDGVFSFTSACTGIMTAKGGINTDTNYPFIGQLKAEAGSTVITSLTTLLVEGKKQGLSEVEILNLLGLDADTAVATTDPIAANDVQLLRTSLAVQQIAQDITKAVYNTNSIGNYGKTFAELAKALSLSFGNQLFAAGGALNLNGAVPVAIDNLNTAGKIDRDNLINEISKRTKAIFAANDDASLLALLQIIQNPEKVNSGDFADTESVQEKEFAGIDSESIKIGNQSFADLGIGTTGKNGKEIVDLDKVKKNGAKVNKIGFGNEGFKLAFAPSVVDLEYSGQKTNIGYQAIGYKTITFELPASAADAEKCTKDNEAQLKQLADADDDAHKDNYAKYQAFCGIIVDENTSAIEIERRIEVLIKDVIVDIKDGKLNIDKDAKGQVDAIAYVYATYGVGSAMGPETIELTLENPVRRNIVKSSDGEISIEYKEIVKAIEEANKKAPSQNQKPIDEDKLLNLTGDFLFSVAIDGLNLRQADGSGFEVISLTLPNIENSTVNGVGIRNGKLTIEE